LSEITFGPLQAGAKQSVQFRCAVQLRWSLQHSGSTASARHRFQQHSRHRGGVADSRHWRAKARRNTPRSPTTAKSSAATPACASRSDQRRFGRSSAHRHGRTCLTSDAIHVLLIFSILANWPSAGPELPTGLAVVSIMIAGGCRHAQGNSSRTSERGGKARRSLSAIYRKTKPVR
jgi:hypothetical protein